MLGLLFENLQLLPFFLLLITNRFDAVDPQLGQSPVCRRGLEFTQSWSCSLNRETNFQLFSVLGVQATQNFCAFHSHYWHRLWQSDYTRKIQLNKSILKGGPFPYYNARTQVFRSFPSNHWMFKKSAECHVFWPGQLLFLLWDGGRCTNFPTNWWHSCPFPARRGFQ